MPLSPIERKAEFGRAAILRKSSFRRASKELGISLTHLLGCLDGSRQPSDSLALRIAAYCGIDTLRYWGRVIQPLAEAC